MRLAADRASTSETRVSGVGGRHYAGSVTSTTTPASAAETRGPAAWLPLAAVAVTLVLWASAFVAIRYLGDEFSPGALSLGRTLIGALCLGVVALATQGVPHPTGR